ncbi:MAG TPA: archemetzincin, partial [candidate division WOR-3 bacterium]|nr:archemetzincin [candidate division WOR-3 bacterium]
GLSHCPDPSCVMHFSNSLMDTDYKKDELCDICNEKMKQILKYLY